MPRATEAKTIVVTGANAGIGFAACGSLCDAGHNVHLVCRSMAKAERACEQLRVRLDLHCDTLAKPRRHGGE